MPVVENGELKLDEQLCFALYAASNAVVRRYRPMLRELGLTYPQYLVMIVLWEGGPATVGRIAERLELDSHAISPLVARLADSGLVTRRAGEDRRQVVVTPSARGRDLEAAAARAQAEVACATGLGAEEFADLRHRLRELGDRLDPTP